MYNIEGEFMVNYPNKKKSTNQLITGPKKQITAYRGMNLEEDLNLTNSYYLNNDIAVIYKKPTPVQIVKVSYPKREAAKIVEAYYRKPSTTDYNGLYKGEYIDFEAKETKAKTFPFSNISDHQIDHLDRIVKHGGIAFVIIAFTTINEVYLLDAEYIIDPYRNAKRRSMTYEQISTLGYLIPSGFNPRLDYLKIVDQVYFRGDKRWQKED